MIQSSTESNRSTLDVMTWKLPLPALLVALLASPATAASPYASWPSKDQLKDIEHAAYNCSRDNTAASCARVRQLADPLLDHPRLTGLCKDVLWALMDEAKVAPINDFRRKDTSPTQPGAFPESAPNQSKRRASPRHYQLRPETQSKSKLNR